MQMLCLCHQPFRAALEHADAWSHIQSGQCFQISAAPPLHLAKTRWNVRYFHDSLGSLVSDVPSKWQLKQKGGGCEAHNSTNERERAVRLQAKIQLASSSTAFGN